MPVNLSLEKQAKARIELLKRQSWNDLYTFTKYVAGKDLLEEQPHREACEFLTVGLEVSDLLNLKFTPPLSVEYVKSLEKRLKKLLMLPRGSFKSTIASTVFPIWLLWHNPNLRILIDCATLGNAKKYLASIKDLIVNSKMIKLICTDDEGNYLLEPNYKISGAFTEDQIILKHRTKLGMKEPSIFLSAVDNNTTGMHPDVIIMDDLVSEDTVKTEAQIEKTKEHYRFSLSLLEPHGLQVVIGTRYHMNDLYADLLDSPSFDKLVRPAILDDGSLYFPTRLGHERLAELRAEQGSYVFSSQYMLTPIDDANAVFKKAWIDYYEVLPPMVERYILIDLAISQKERADYTVVMAVGIDMNKKLYVVDYDRGHYTPKQTIDAIFGMYKRQHSQGLVKAVGIETVAYQKAMLYMIQDEMRRTGVYMPLKELKADKDKMRRIQALQPMFENGAVLISPKHKELEQELLEFPYSQHDDIIDALAYVVQVMKPGSVRTRPLRPIYHSNNQFTNY